MTSEHKDDSKFGWKDGVALFGLRVVDSGFLPWVLVAGFCLGLVYILTRNLASADNLTLLSKLMETKLFAFGGWILALLQLPIFVVILRRTKRLGRNRLKYLEDENVKAREMLKKSRQGELKLEQ